MKWTLASLPAAAAIVLTCALPTRAADYYVDAAAGDDTNDGLAEAPQGGGVGPWRTLAKINDHAEAPGFQSGDVIALKRGAVWANDEPIGWEGDYIHWGDIDGLTITDYGATIDPKPRIDCTTQTAAAIGGNSTLSNLTIQNLDASGMAGPTVAPAARPARAALRVPVPTRQAPERPTRTAAAAVASRDRRSPARPSRCSPCCCSV